MSYCFNPNCCQPNNELQVDVCSSCGNSLLLRRYRGVKLLAKSQLALTIEVVEIDPTKLENTSNSDRLVLKILLTNYPKAIALFQQEAQILGQINHVGVPKLAANGYFSWQPKGYKYHLHCLVMSKISGVDLELWFKQSGNRPIDEEQAKPWLKQILDILTELHANQYFHRDILHVHPD